MRELLNQLSACCFACVSVECIPSSCTYKDLAVNPNLAPAFNSGFDTVLDFDPSYEFYSTFGFGPGPLNSTSHAAFNSDTAQGSNLYKARTLYRFYY
ncbi:hypothetical protein EVAR_11606_1 [Eumeta japonica]|uniref:Uncharacterized protein n=1 Tax=Eumeta variegata TaxID=151549 RepID=A0A4C1X3L0_EUMVA|nr:hypothetical protein EVAR_11606_1 [Eumeta japonica]